MEQLFFFTDLQSIEYAELEGLIDPKLDADFLAEISQVFATLESRAGERAARRPVAESPPARREAAGAAPR